MYLRLGGIDVAIALFLRRGLPGLKPLLPLVHQLILLGMSFDQNAFVAKDFTFILAWKWKYKDGLGSSKRRRFNIAIFIVFVRIVL